jgi:hypothetical protein
LALELHSPLCGLDSRISHLHYTAALKAAQLDAHIGHRHRGFIQGCEDQMQSTAISYTAASKALQLIAHIRHVRYCCNRRPCNWMYTSVIIIITALTLCKLKTLQPSASRLSTLDCAIGCKLILVGRFPMILILLSSCA